MAKKKKAEKGPEVPPTPDQDAGPGAPEVVEAPKLPPYRRFAARYFDPETSKIKETMEAAHSLAFPQPKTVIFVDYVAINVNGQWVVTEQIRRAITSDYMDVREQDASLSTSVVQ